jgi:hypothetical protein
MSEARIVYHPRADATPEGEVAALASVYRFILVESSARKEAGCPGGPETTHVRNAKEVSYVVENRFDETSSIVHHGFTKENE